MSRDASCTLRARWVLTPNRPPLADGVVTVQHGRIRSLGTASTVDVDVDLGAAILFPGLVNAHTHLEFSLLNSPLGEHGSDFPAWIRHVLAYRAQQFAAPTDSRDDPRATAIRQGWSELTTSGVWNAGEIVTQPFSPDTYRAADFRGVLYHERLGLSESRPQEALAELTNTLPEKGSRETWRSGLSPHAPYSVHWRLFQGMLRLARERLLPVAMHLAESEQEIEFLKTRQGPFHQLLEELGVWNAGAWPTDLTLLDYVRELTTAPRALIVHGNYLGPTELDLIAAHREQCCVVYCPRTHSYFQHRTYPLLELLRRSIRVAVATDSRGSNPDLCLGRDLQYVASQFPELSPQALLAMVTSSASWGLGGESQFGGLEPGHRAELSYVAIPTGVSAADPWTIFLAELAQSQRWRAPDSTDLRGMHDA